MSWWKNCTAASDMKNEILKRGNLSTAGQEHTSGLYLTKQGYYMALVNRIKQNKKNQEILWNWLRRCYLNTYLERMVLWTTYVSTAMHIGQSLIVIREGPCKPEDSRYTARLYRQCAKAVQRTFEKEGYGTSRCFSLIFVFLRPTVSFS